MSHFYGCVQGQAGEGTRRGSKKSGLSVTAASWNGCICVRLWQDNEGVDRFHVYQDTWQSSGKYEALASGVIGQLTTEKESETVGEIERSRMSTATYWINMGILGDKELLVEYEFRSPNLEVTNVSLTDTDVTWLLKAHLERSQDFYDHVTDVERLTREVEKSFEAYIEQIICTDCE